MREENKYDQESSALRRFFYKLWSHPIYSRLLILTGIIILFYLAGMLAQIEELGFGGSTWYSSYGTPITKTISGAPWKAIAFLFEDVRRFKSLVIVLIALTFLSFLFGSKWLRVARDERGISRAVTGTHGTSKWMPDDVRDKEFNVVRYEKQSKGIILGRTIEVRPLEKQGRLITTWEEPQYEGDTRYMQFNRNYLVHGKSGSGKTRRFVFPFILQAMRRGQSLIVTDPKGELFEETHSLLLHHGYKVKVLNLKDLRHSDGWNPLYYLIVDESKITNNVVEFVHMLLTNLKRPGAREDSFWSTARSGLLTAVVLMFAYEGLNGDYHRFTMGHIREFIGSGLEVIKSEMDSLSAEHPAKNYWIPFTESKAEIQSSVVLGLANELNIFLEKNLRKVLQHNDIDLLRLSQEKCAYYLVIPDFSNPYEYITALFFSAAMKTTSFYIDTHREEALIPICMVMDEMLSIGELGEDLILWLRVARSRKFTNILIVQSLSDFNIKYPGSQWHSIQNNCDTEIILTTNDTETAKHASERVGSMTVNKVSTGRSTSPTRVIPIPTGLRENTGEGGRPLLYPDEIMRMPIEQGLMLYRASFPLMFTLYDYSEHPMAKHIRKTLLESYIPEWQIREIKEDQQLENENYEKPAEVNASAAPINPSTTNRNCCQSTKTNAQNYGVGGESPQKRNDKRPATAQHSPKPVPAEPPGVNTKLSSEERRRFAQQMMGETSMKPETKPKDMPVYNCVAPQEDKTTKVASVNEVVKPMAEHQEVDVLIQPLAIPRYPQVSINPYAYEENGNQKLASDMPKEDEAPSTQDKYDSMKERIKKASTD